MSEQERWVWTAWEWCAPEHPGVLGIHETIEGARGRCHEDAEQELEWGLIFGGEARQNAKTVVIEGENVRYWVEGYVVKP